MFAMYFVYIYYALKCMLSINQKQERNEDNFMDGRRNDVRHGNVHGMFRR